MSKIPSFQFYPADWRKDPGVQSLSFHDRGVWFEILCLMHESEQRGKLLLNGKAMPEDALARLLGLDKQVLIKSLQTLVEYGVVSRCQETGALMNRRMVRDETLMSVRRRCGKMGGNPNLLNQNSNQKPTTQDNQNQTTQDNQSPTPSSSSSSSKQKKEKSPALPAVELIPKILDTPSFRTAWHEWKAFRAAKKNKLTDLTAQKQLAMLAEYSPEDAVSILNTSIMNGWVGLFPEKVAQKKEQFRKEPLELSL